LELEDRVRLSDATLVGFTKTDMARWWVNHNTRWR
jgi:hypothetical protein